MIVYILNFVLCSGLLLLVYRVFLGYENLYRFNRFYLLFSLAFSLIVPFITIGVQHIKVPVLDQQIISQRVAAVVNSPVRRQVMHHPVISGAVHQGVIPVQQPTISQSMSVIAASPVHQQILQSSKHNYFPYLLAIYTIITLVMLGRLAFNGYKIDRLVAKNTIIPCQDIKLVLLEEEVTPHSFLKYVFINESEYQNGLIEPEIICHEQTHAKQLHSLDVIAVELLRAVCWFNPFISSYRRAMQLNHEFLADEAVVKSYDNTPAYQYLLLSKVGQCGSLYLTSQFNYLATKKRLMMMTKTTSAKIALYKKLALAPLIVYALLLFCNKGIAQTTRIAVKSAYKNVAIAIDKINLATDPAPTNPIANQPLATENAADSTNTQPQVAVSAPLITENADSSASVQHEVTITDTSAKKVPNVQKASVYAPANIKIDGELKEWNNKNLSAYNSANRIYYVVSNDDNYLYLTVRGSGTAAGSKILAQGIKFTVSHSLEKSKRNKDAGNVSITYPGTPNALTVSFVMAPNIRVANFLKDAVKNKKQIDSLTAIANTRVESVAKEIRIQGIKDIKDSVLSVYNDAGIKAAIHFSKGEPIVELAIPLKYLDLTADGPLPFSYNIKLPGPTVIFNIMDIQKSGVSTIPTDELYRFSETDLWGEYILAKKNP